PGRRAGPSTGPHAVPTPGTGPVRRRIERASLTPMTVLAGLPRWLPALLMGGLLVVGLAVHGPLGFLAALVVVAFLGWLSYLSWRQLSRTQQMLRLVVLALLLAVAVVALLPRR
ncbi:MAG: DUF6703 family protein, partial [Actinomycetes bacterium]